MRAPSVIKRQKKYSSRAFLTGYWGSRGGFSSIPNEVIEGPDWINLSYSASKVLVILVNMYKGWNNGDLAATQSMMSKFGITSPTTLTKALSELMNSGLIIKTQAGFRGMDGTRKPNLYALSWLPIDEIEQEIDGQWLPKIHGTSKAPRMQFSMPFSLRKNNDEI